MIRFGPVPYEQTEIVWPHIEGYMRDLEARMDGGVTPDLIKRRVHEQTWQLWIAMDGADVLGFLTTELTNDHRGTVYMLNMAGRDFQKWREAGINAVEDWAREIGSTHVVGVCRDGLVREMAKHGYRKTANVIERAL